ncbi:hypothetical protein NQ318_003315 [Aromia moschata]|uniref:CUB domain-containing protein n=1 Tax=Aromia moschata TaxID=1265417 RepID=A0AAV8YMR4_9CUCU|nr:hypothetical protein NQ318_003315 [Aromia moschata]
MKVRSTSLVCTALVVLFEVVSSVFDDVDTTTISGEIQTEETTYNNSVCGGVFIDKQFTLRSPNYPENYPVDVECNYLLKGPECASYYEFRFLDFDVEETEGCTKDRFEVEGQGALCGGRNEVKRYFAKNGSLHVKFTADGLVSRRGYDISVTRMGCEKIDQDASESEATTEILTETTTEYFTESIPRLIESRHFPNILQDEPECCTSNFNAKQFILTSPNFPYSVNKETNCLYTINKAHANICRLRLNFLFFWLGLGNSQSSCPYGFLEIDGKQICGCNKAIQLTTSFGSSDIKKFRFRTGGFYQETYTGFVIEVIQDECPIKYSPGNAKQFNNQSNRSQYKNDQINRVAWPNDGAQTFLEKLHLINERTEIIDDEDVYAGEKPKIIKSIYYFAAPEYNDIPELFEKREMTTYEDTSSINSILTDNNYFECANWNQIQYKYLENSYGNSLRICKPKETEANIRNNVDCVQLNYPSGYFRSPCYPYYYPGNLNMCYRIIKQPGYCKLKIYMQDFQIEPSLGCEKDYVLMENGTIDIQNKAYEDMRFVTDGYYCGRGFSGVYEQIACQDMSFPFNPPDPSVHHTTQRPITCAKVIRDRSFTIKVEEDYRACTFTIQKYSKNVCKIMLNFEELYLPCGMESLVIDRKHYCGNLTGQSVTVNFYHDSLSIVYKSEKSIEDKHDKVTNVHVNGQQIIPEVPAERLRSIKPKSQQATNSSKNTIEDIFNPQSNSKYIVALINKQFKDICGIVTNTTDKELPPTLCEILMNEHNATKCIPLSMCHIK